MVGHVQCICMRRTNANDNISRKCGGNMAHESQGRMVGSNG